MFAVYQHSCCLQRWPVQVRQECIAPFRPSGPLDRNFSGLTWKRAVVLVWDALPGLATTSLIDLQHRALLEDVAVNRIASHPTFDPERGFELALCLRLRDCSLVLTAISENRFLMCALEAASKGLWDSPPLPLCTLEQLPNPFRQRPFLGDLERALSAAIAGGEQRWICVSGAGGSGKTVNALFLASRTQASVVLWIRFGARPDTEIAESAVRKSFPSSDPEKFASAKDFLSATLTPEATEDCLIIADDVRASDHLAPFAKAKVVLLTSRKRICYRKVARTEVFDVPRDLEEEEVMT